MGALAVDMQLDFWTAPEPEPATPPAPVRAVMAVRDQPMGGGRTLEDVILGAWEGLAAHRSVDCLICGGEMVPQITAHARLTGATCERCGTRLS